ncbi:hypothetical protein C0993_005400 [Termitomyces sp. T159_Od127]|nr:hypothetical protein C0993_005400 [Termitomyces sp. T159_Od127]
MLMQLEALASQDLPLETKLMVQNTMREEIEKKLGSEQIAKETKRLVDSVIKIDQGFERVKIELGGIDSVQFRGKPVEAFQPQWVEHQQRFVSLVWRSRTVARRIGAYVNGKVQSGQLNLAHRSAEFVDMILQTLEDIRNRTEYKGVAADLTEFAMRKNPFGRDLVLDARGEMHSPDFTELQCDIKVFRDIFELFNEEQGIELQGDVVLLQEEISDLVWQIKRRKTLVPRLSY